MFKDIAHVLHNPLRVRALTFFVRRPGNWGSTEEVASVIGGGRALVQRELLSLARSGVLKTKKIKRTTLFTANEKYPLFGALHTFIGDSCIPTEKEIASAFRGERNVVQVVAAGLLTQEERSSVDLLIVVRKITIKNIQKAVKKVEALAAVPLRYTVLEVGDYLARKQAYDRMLRDIFEYKHVVVLEKAFS